MQNTSTMEILSGEKKVTVFGCFSGTGSKPPAPKHWTFSYIYKKAQHIYKLYTYLQNYVLPLGPVAYNKIKIKIE